MLIVFGFKVRFNTIATLTFFCPRCGGDRVGARRTARRWFAIFWVPVIPLNPLGEVLECQSCHTRFDPAVADRPTTADLASILTNATRVLTAMIVGTGDREDVSVRAAAVAEIATSTDGYDERTLDGDIDALDPALAEEYVGPLAEGLAVPGKERLLGGLVGLALTGGTITDGQRRVIDRAGRGLGLTAAHVTGIVTSVAAATTPPAAEPPLDGADPST